VHQQQQHPASCQSGDALLQEVLDPMAKAEPRQGQWQSTGIGVMEKIKRIVIVAFSISRISKVHVRACSSMSGF